MKPVVSSGCFSSLIFLPQQIRPRPLLPWAPSIAWPAPARTEEESITLTMPCGHVASPTWIRDGFRVVFVAEATASGSRRCSNPICRKVFFAAGTLVLTLGVLSRQFLPARGLPLVTARGWGSPTTGPAGGVGDGWSHGQWSLLTEQVDTQCACCIGREGVCDFF